ncbi:MAG TPA: hypothetical protein VFD32_09570 [Dehalococcoidia bacterium]|nr:hypothetical protein [Dehalococcoidia bacterium]
MVGPFGGGVRANLPGFPWQIFFQPDELLMLYEPKAGTKATRALLSPPWDPNELLKILRTGGIPAASLGTPVPIYNDIGTVIVQPVHLLDWVPPGQRRAPAAPGEVAHLGKRMAEVWSLARDLNGPNRNLARFDIADHAATSASPNWIAMPHV